MKKAMVRKGLTASALLGLSLASSMGYAAEGFKVRFPLSGSLGGEMVAPITPGVFGSVVATQINIDKITGPNGQAFSTPVAGMGTVSLGFDQKQTLYNLIVGYTSNETYADGRITVALNVPYASIDRTVNAVSSGLGPLAALSSSASGQVDALGDMEVTGLWSRQTERTKYALGVTVSAPTGAYNKDPKAINVGFGNFYTIRPGAAIAYKATEELTLGARASLAFNTKNLDNKWSSGDFYVIDLAAAYRTPIGVVGPHVLRVEQYKDDIGAVGVTGPLGTNRFSSTSAGVFFTTLIPGINAGLNLSYMKTLESKNSLSGSFIQARLSKVF